MYIANYVKGSYDQYFKKTMQLFYQSRQLRSLYLTVFIPRAIGLAALVIARSSLKHRVPNACLGPLKVSINLI